MEGRVAITSNFSVGVIEDNYNDDNGYIANLYKWWWDSDSESDSDYKNVRLNINNPEQWEEIKRSIDYKLADKLGWKSKEEFLDEFEETTSNKELNKKAKKFISQHPNMVNILLDELDIDSFEKDAEYLSRLIQVLDDKLENASNEMKNNLIEVVESLGPKDQMGLEELKNILDKWTLYQATSVTTLIQNRINTIDIFDEMIQNDNTFELKGDESVHRFLEKNLWLLDDSYWMLQSNRTLRTFIGDEIMKKDEEYSDKRPDFVCASFDNQLVVVELKRPSKKPTKKDVDQLEEYIMIAQDYKGESFRKTKGYLIGKKFDSNTKRLINRRRDLKPLTYTDVISDVRSKYKDYIEKLEEAKEEEQKIQDDDK